jgi:hypothetical protein
VGRSGYACAVSQTFSVSGSNRPLPPKNRASTSVHRFRVPRRKDEFCLFWGLHGNDKVIRTRAITFIIAASASAGKTYLSGRRVPVNSHRAGGGRNRPYPVTRHRNTGSCSERVAHFLCGLHDPLWLCRAHYVLARISSKCRCAECQREHDTSASNRRTAKATKPVSYCHAVIVIPFRLLRKLS